MKKLLARPALSLLILPAAVLIIGILGSVLLADQVRRASDSRDRDRFERLIDEQSKEIGDRIQNHIALLRGAAGLVKVSPNLNRTLFSSYVERLRIPEYYPGVQGIGYAVLFDASERSGVESRLRAEYGRDIPLRPEGDRGEYSAILYLEPQDDRNQVAIGFDMYSEPVRRTAMAAARDNATASMSGMVRLVQEKPGEDQQPGFLIYTPVFLGSGIPETAQDRRNRFLGWAYSPFRARDFFQQVAGKERPGAQFEMAVFDGDRTDPAGLLYRTGAFDPEDTSGRGERTIDHGNHTWTAVFAATPAFFADSNRHLANYVLVTGIVISLLLCGAALAQARATRQSERARAELQAVNDQLALQMEEVEERTADLREANDEIQRFAYIVSHDLRSPLVNIMGFTTEIENLKKDTFEQLSALREPDTEAAKSDIELSREFDESLGFIKSAIGKMDRLINSILKLSREGRREFKPEYISMEALLKTITDSVAHQAYEQDIEISLEPLPAVKSDRVALEQIFSNLVDNAMKYTKPGRPGRIRISGRTEGARAIYEIEDNGRGIAPEDQQRVFDLFRRAGQQDKPGEGIGLAHVRTLVRRLGGYMSLKSELGEGTTFTIALPRRMQDESRHAA